METPTFASRMNGHRRLAQSTCLAALLVAALALPGALTGQAATVTTTGSGNWSNTTPDAPWPGGAVPAPGSDIVINNGYTVTVTANVTNSPATITISAGSQLSVGGFNLTSGATTVYGTLLHTSAAGAHSFIGDVTIASGGIWNETAAAIISYGGNLQNDGTLTASTGMHTFTGTNKTFSGANEIAISNLTVTGSYQNNGALTVATLLTVTSPGVVTNNGTITATASLAGTGALTQGAGATLNLSGTSAITTLNAAASPNTVNFSGAAQTVNVVTYNSLILSGSGAKPLTSISTINSNLTLSGTATAATAVNLSIGGNLSVGTGSTFTVAGITLTVTGDTTVSGQLAHNNTTGLKTFSGNVTINSGGFWNETAAAQISIGGNLQIDGTNVASTGIHTFTGSGKTLSGARGIVIPNVTINGTYQNNATQTVETALAGTGTLTQGPGATLNLGGPANTAITITNLNALSNINSVKYTNALQTVKPTPYYYLILSGNGAKTMTGVTNISADLTISGSATITSNAALTIGGALNYLSSGSSTLTNNLSGNALTITNGTLDLGAGLTHIFTGTWTRAAGTLMGGSSTLKIGGSVSGAGGAFTAGTSTVEWNAAGDQTLAAVTYNKLILSGSGAKAIGAGTAVAGNLNIATSARASVGNGLNIGVGSLTFDGAGQANGTWGSSSAPYATRQNDVFFSPTTGYLAVNADLRPTTVTWRGTGDWFRAVGTWSNGVPGPGSNVWIASGSVTLTNATPQLGEFAIGEATLVFTNWNTYLTASNVAVLSNGVMTLPPAFTTNAGLSNRVWVVCTNLTINAGGQINTDYKGYAGGLASANGYGPGAGLASAGGAGHGGRGGTIGSAFGANPFADSGGGAYDSASAPNQPGSGGAGQANAGAGGSGGGVI
ncbi:MAG: hypothetical protein WCL16_03950, partial [bacterium]